MTKYSWIAIIALVAVSMFAITQSASALTKWTADPADVPAGAFCDDDADFSWYQMQHRNETGETDFSGAVVACSGWDAIARVAKMHGYDSVDAAGVEWVAGNRNRSWVSELQPVSNFTP